MSADAQQLAELHSDVDALLAHLTDAEQHWQPSIDAVAADRRCSATNLVHYLALGDAGIPDVSQRLTQFGLASPAHSPAHVQPTVRLASAAIAAMRGQDWAPDDASYVAVADGVRRLERSATELLGSDDDGIRIARIDCARDDATAWKALAANVRGAAAAADETCLVVMELAGPQLRTGPVEQGPQVVRLRPTRNAQGQVVAAGRGWLTSARRPARPPEPKLPTLPVKAEWLANRAEGDELLLRDTRGSKRRLLLAAAAPGGFVVSTEKTTYIGTGTVLKAGGKKNSVKVGELHPIEQSFRVAAGDIVRLTRDCAPAQIDDDLPPRIGCTLPEFFSHAEVGQRIVIGAGALAGLIVAVTGKRVDVRLTHPAEGTEKLCGGMEITAPDTDIPVPALTDQDVTDLSMAVELADLVQLSVREPADVIRLFDELDRLGDHDLGVVLTIEHRRALDQLPQLLLAALRRPRVAVAIPPENDHARRLCEAAHIPVID